MYNVHNEWDQLRVSVVGVSYPPDFYKFISKSAVRNAFEKIAQETADDLNAMANFLETRGIKVLRPTVNEDLELYRNGNSFMAPPMCPRDHMIMIGNQFYLDDPIDKSAWTLDKVWNVWRGDQWPENPPADLNEYNQLPDFIKNEIHNITQGQFIKFTKDGLHFYNDITEHVTSQGNAVTKGRNYHSAGMLKLNDNLYIGTDEYGKVPTRHVTGYKTKVVDTRGHIDGTFCPIKPGLVLSLGRNLFGSGHPAPDMNKLFPDWEVVYIDTPSVETLKEFTQWKSTIKNKWWVPGQEFNQEFTDFVENNLQHWTGYVSETVFDVNLLQLDQNNVVCSNYNQKVFDAFKRHNVNAHIIDFRHRYFWDAGWHCLTNDLHRQS